MKLVVKIKIKEEKKQVWEYYTNPVHITQWNFASDDWCCPYASNDLMVGGTYHVRMEAKDKSFGFDLKAKYQEVCVGERLHYVLEDRRFVETIFIQVGDYIMVQTTFDAEQMNPLELQQAGWQAILNQFKYYVETKIHSKIPAYLKEGGCIGIVAPSFGVGFEGKYYQRHMDSIEHLKQRGFKLKISENYGNTDKAQSASPEVRAKEFMDFYLDDEVDVIWSLAGGEVMCEILPYIDFEVIKQAKPKWFIGFSDNTNLIYPLATICNTASLYAMCSQDFYTCQPKEASDDVLDLLMNRKTVFHQYGDEKTYSIANQDEELEGYLLGGCVDIIQILIGTKYDQTIEYIKQKKDVILFLEACDFTVFGVKRFFWQLKELGYLENIKGIIFGKMLHPESYFNISYQSILEELHLNIPIIYDVEVGHVGATLPFVSNAYAKIRLKDNCFSIQYDLNR